MLLTRARVLLALLLLAAAGAAGFTYFKYRKISAYVADQIGNQAAKKLGRQVRFSSVSYSPLKGIVLRDACVSRRPDFSRGEFFCAKKTVIRPRLRALLRNRVSFSGVVFEQPVLKVREKGGRWDFEDLLALLPETDKGLYLTWNASELAMRGGRIEADLETSGLSLALEDLDLELDHHSSYGGNFGLQAACLAKTVYKGKLVSAGVSLKTESNFAYGGLASAKGEFRARDISYGAMTLETFSADWDLFNMRKPLGEKNYSVSVNAEGLLLPAQESAARDGVARGLELFSAAMGRTVPKIEDIEMRSFAAAFRLDDSVLALKEIALRTNFLELDAALTIFGPQRKADASLKAVVGDSKLEMSAAGPLDAPRIKPLLSSTLTAKFKSALAAAENSLLKIFPVTGE
jgi:hypothetical protein